MSNPLPLIVQTEHLAPVAADWLRERSTLVQVSPNDPQFSRVIANAEGLIVRTYTRVDDALLDQAPRLRVIGRAGAGLDNIDVASCRSRGVEVVYTPEANTQAVVEFVLSMMCDSLRPRAALSQAVDGNEWNRLRAEFVGRREMSEVTLGILGMGRIGKRLAQTAHLLFKRMIYNDLLEVAPDRRWGAEPVSIDDLFSRADVLSVHIDGRPANRRFIGAALLSRMRDDAVFINTSRGFVVDNLSLASYLRGHPAAKAMLDVHEPEPFGADYPLLNMANVALYPHLASRTERAMENMSWVVRDVMAVLERKAPAFPASLNDGSRPEPRP